MMILSLCKSLVRSVSTPLVDGFILHILLFIFNTQHHSSVCGIGKSERYYE
jgi:hypothetical protein